MERCALARNVQNSIKVLCNTRNAVRPISGVMPNPEAGFRLLPEAKYTFR